MSTELIVVSCAGMLVLYQTYLCHDHAWHDDNCSTTIRILLVIRYISKFPFYISFFSPICLRSIRILFLLLFIPPHSDVWRRPEIFKSKNFPYNLDLYQSFSRMATENYQLAKVLAVAEIHPFYNPNVLYPADTETIEKISELIDKKEIPTLHGQPLLSKKTL